MSLKETSYLSQELHDKMCLKIADLIRVIDKLFREYYQKNVRYASLKNQHEQQCALNKRLEADNQALNEANAKLSEEILTLKSSIARSNSKLDELANNHTQLLTTASNEIESLKLELSEIKSLRESESKRLQVCQKCIEFGREVKQLQLLLEDQSDKLIQLDKSKNNFLREKKELNSQIQLTNDEKRVLNDKLMAVQSKLTQCISENESLKSNLYDLQAKIKLSKSPKKLSDSSIKRQYWLQSTPDTSEIERLKQELQKYKMELMNRETNFNRIFTSTSMHHPQIKLGEQLHKDDVQLPSLYTSKRSIGLSKK